MDNKEDDGPNNKKTSLSDRTTTKLKCICVEAYHPQIQRSFHPYHHHHIHIHIIGQSK
jgi:hypothetical protein